MSKQTAKKKTAKKAKPAAKTAKSPAKKAVAKKASPAKARAKSAKQKPTQKKKAAATKASATKKASKTKATAQPKSKPAAKPAKAKSAPAAKKARPAKAPTRPRPRRFKRVTLPAGYQPSESEPFMNDKQVQYFHDKLVNWKNEIIRETKETLAGLTEDSIQHADIADRATSETDRAYELRARDRQRKLVSKIDAALSRIEDGSYGYCEETGEPIGLRRLEARPIATLSLEAQERHERRERVYRED